MKTETSYPLAGLLPEELTSILLELGEKKYRAGQILEWYYRKLAKDFSEMTNLPVQLQAKLKEKISLIAIQLKERLASIDGTTKYLFQLGTVPAGYPSAGWVGTEQSGVVGVPAIAGRGLSPNLIESVLIPQDLPHQVRNTVCLSTQVGCAYGCKFCASGRTGFVRDLTAGEIVEQLLWIQREIRPDTVNNIVFMGMGEPLANYDNMMKAVRIINSPSCAGIGSRKITISTCGLVPGIKRLPAENIQIELSISLHAPDDRTRNFLLPVNKKFPVAILISACREYVRKTNRQITFEYILINGVNDSTLQAEELGRLLKGLNCKVNLIPYNKIEGIDFKSPSAEAVDNFREALFHAGVRSFIRQARGQDIAGACGQLRLKNLNHQK